MMYVWLTMHQNLCSRKKEKKEAMIKMKKHVMHTQWLISSMDVGDVNEREEQKRRKNNDNPSENDATTKYTQIYQTILKIKPSSQNLRFIFFSSSSCVCWTGTSCGASESIMIKGEKEKKTSD